MQLIQGICNPADLFDDISNERNAKLRPSVVVPKISQISSISPPKHKIAFPSSDSCNELNNMLMVELVDINVSLDLSLPRLIKRSLVFFIFSMVLFDLLDGNVGSFTIKLIRH